MKGFLALLSLAILACYAPGLSAPPSFNDAPNILHNPKMMDDKALLRGFVDPTERFYHGVPLDTLAYRPLTDLTLSWNLRLADHSIVGLRFGNDLIHVVAVIAGFFLVRCLAGEPAARWAALFLAIHPQGVHAVTYVAQRAVVLEAALAFSTLYFYVRRRTRLALASAFLCIGARETAATLPLLLAVVEWFLRDPREAWGTRLRRFLPFCLPFVVLVVQVWRGVVALRESRGVDLLRESGLGSLEYLSHELPLLWHYVRGVFLPFPLQFGYERAIPGCPPPLLVVLISGVGLLAVMGWVLLGPERHRTARLGTALFLAPLALESSVIPVAQIACSYRLYPALLGAGMLFASFPRFARWAAVPLLFLLTFSENRAWTLPPELYRRDVRHAFHMPELWSACASDCHQRGWTERAERLSRTGCRLPRKDYRLLASRAEYLQALGRTEEAAASLDALRRAFPDRAEPLWPLILGAERMRDEAALDALERRIGAAARPEAVALFWAVRRMTAAGHWKEAEAVLGRSEEALRLLPNFWDHLGQVRLGLGQEGKAEEAYRRALELEPSLYKSRNNLGLILYRRGDLAGAEREFREALRLRPDYALASRNLDRILMKR